MSKRIPNSLQELGQRIINENYRTILSLIEDTVEYRLTQRCTSIPISERYIHPLRFAYTDQDFRIEERLYRKHFIFTSTQEIINIGLPYIWSSFYTNPPLLVVFRDYDVKRAFGLRDDYGNVIMHPDLTQITRCTHMVKRKELSEQMIKELIDSLDFTAAQWKMISDAQIEKPT